MKVLVTGANGFVGRALCPALAEAGHRVVAALRHPKDARFRHAGIEVVATASLGPEWRWPNGLAEIDAVVHLAARVHRLREDSHDPLRDYRETNVEGTRALLQQSRQHGVRRFVHLSSIKAADDRADPYGLSKLEAEAVVAEYRQQGMETVIVRPPLVYGPGVGGNFRRLLRWLDLGIPLPLAAIDNRRSLVFVGNLCAALRACLEHPAAAGNAYGVCDGEDMATPELLRRMGAALECPARLFPLPTSILRAGARLVGREADFGRLCGSLTVDADALRRDLGWRPPYSMDEGLAMTAAWYRQSAANEKGAR